MLQRAVNVVSFRIEGKKQKFSLHIDDAIPETLIGDSQRLAQVVANLLGNAEKFTPEKGSIELDARLLSENDNECTVQIAVTDTGIGVSPEQQTTLFLSFQQAENDTSRKFGGTGLGLSISKSIVEMMGGRIMVESELGKGSTFSFSVRLSRNEVKKQDVDDVCSGTDTEQSGDILYDITDAFAGRNILLAEDVKINQDIVLALLEPTGLGIDCAGNGAEAVRMFSEMPEKYEMIFMDVQMPEVDGYEATRRIRALDIQKAKTIPIIAMTANVFREDIEQCLNAGMNAHIGKPIDFDKLRDILVKYFEN